MRFGNGTEAANASFTWSGKACSSGVPMFPALFDGQRLPRSATPAVGGPRRPF